MHVAPSCCPGQERSLAQGFLVPEDQGASFPFGTLPHEAALFLSLLLYLKQCVVINHETDVFLKPLLTLS